MSRDNYQGVPKKFVMRMDKDGKVQHPRPSGAADSTSAFTPVLVGSGVLTAGYANMTDPSIGWHSMVVVSASSGTKTAPIAHAIDAAAQTVHFSGEDNADVRRFSYVVFNPGLGSPKV